jgi:dolichol-phosphate mannosyltransferase
MELSVVVPVHNEADNIAPLVAEIRAALDGKLAYEIVYVDDASRDGTAAALATLTGAGSPLRVVRHLARCGQSAAIRSGVKAARAPWIATLDGDGQNDPADIPSLWALHQRNDGAVMIAGQRAKRRDSFSKRISSRWANRIRRRLLKDDTPDTGCGLKLFERASFLELPYFDHMHRFLAALMIRQGVRVVSVPVNHRPRLRGASKYGFWDRLWVGIADLLGVMWLQRRASIPRIEGE